MLEFVVTPARRRVDMSAYGDVIPGMPSLTEKFSGADLSLTSTGLATIQYGRARRGLLSSGELIKRGTNKGMPEEGTPADLRGVERLEWLETKLDEQISGRVPELVAIEGYSFASKSNHHSIGEWGGVAKLLLRRHGVSMVLFAPAQVKKFATGDHQADKTKVSHGIRDRWGIIELQNDKADALVLAIMAICIARPGCIELTKFQKEALTKAEKI